MTETSDLLKFGISIAQDEKIDEVIAQRTKGKGYQIRFSNSMIDNSKIWRDDNLELFLAKGKKSTYLEIEAPTQAKIRSRIKDASKFLERLPDSFLYNGMESNQHEYEKLNKLYDPKIMDFSDKAPELVNAAIQASLESGAKKVAGVLYFGRSETELSTSYGNEGLYLGSYYRFTIRSFVDPDSSGQGLACSRNLSGVENDFLKAGNNAGEIAKMAIGGTQGTPGKYDVIMSPTVAANVLGQVFDGLNPVKIMVGMSPLKYEHVGKQIASKEFTVIDDALLAEGLGSRPFDVEGTPKGKTPIFSDGVLKGLLQNTSTSNMDKVENTGNSTFFDFGIGSKFLAPGPSNIAINGGDYTLEEIIAESKKPTIYITSNWYTRFTNMTEGIFSTIPRDGMFLIENGEIKKPVRRLRLSDNLLRICSNISAIGKDIKQIYWWEVLTPTFTPTIKVKDCTITAATQ
ncbi:MAG TPA: TldD/PmbA family protein [Candidatus Nanopelagicaceae bacterium]|nr:TldD/PmbA family protein [Candidatus Nanopelagicaceae bacterium]